MFVVFLIILKFALIFISILILKKYSNFLNEAPIVAKIQAPGNWVGS